VAFAPPKGPRPKREGRTAIAIDSTDRSALDELALFARYATGLRKFLSTPVSAEEAERGIVLQLERREESFLRLLEKGVYGVPRSPYRLLLDHAGVEFGDVARLVREDGLEAALGRLYDADVYVTLDEFKGRRPLERPGLCLSIDAGDFDNPVLSKHYAGQSGGSGGAPRRLVLDLGLLAHEAGHHALFLSAFDLWGRPFALWRGVAPATTGIGNSLRHVKLGNQVERWFNHYKAPGGLEAAKFSLFTRYTVVASRFSRAPLPTPEYVAADDALRVARWLAEKVRQGTPALFDTQASLAVRVCLAAKEHRLDIAGTFFRLGGEPYTEAKARVIGEVGCRAACHYSMTETGRIGIACGNPAALDDVHIATEKLAVLQRDKVLDGTDVQVGALYLTTLHPSCPKLMFNVEVDDYGILEQRACGCPAGRLGLSLHLHRIRSYEKLTSDSINMLASDLIALVEDVFPARFGGHSTDYQLVEEEVEGLPKVNVIVAPRVGVVDEDEVVKVALDALDTRRSNAFGVELWRAGHTLRVVRREPYPTPANKIFPLHILRDG
jgi:hypothetical protein